jgi:U3 small nucleolar RNA-associated protein 22
LGRLHPDKNGVRNALVDEDCLRFSTPHYNNEILSDMFLKSHLALLHQCAQDSPGFVDAIMLGKVWLQQREMSQAAGHIDGFLLSMLLVYLFQQRKINRQMSSYQILRVFMQFIGSPPPLPLPLPLPSVYFSIFSSIPCCFSISRPAFFTTSSEN